MKATCELKIRSLGERDQYTTSCGQKFTDHKTLRNYYKYDDVCGWCRKTVKVNPD